MSFDIFSESFYLKAYPDVANAVARGRFTSGFQHLTTVGLSEGRTLVSPLFSEARYLQAYPGVANAVARGDFNSGLEHFMLVGEANGLVGTFGNFSEQSYLRVNPDVVQAVSRGTISSGFQHFVNFGIDEGRYAGAYNEQYYLLKYSDVANAVTRGTFSSGLDHFLKNGLQERRTGAIEFNERFYLRDNPSVATAVTNGSFESGLEHFIRFGQAEGRSGTYFDEGAYRRIYPDVAQAVQAGNFESGLEHYLKFGQFEGRTTFFSGTNGNDIVNSGISNGSSGLFNFNGVLGVSLDLVRLTNFFEDISSTPFLGAPSVTPGEGEVDILIGDTGGNDFFFLGNPTADDPLIGTTLIGRTFYVGQGASDYALIRNFNRSEDRLTMSGIPIEYNQQVVNGSLEISTTSGDLIAIVEGQSSTLTPSNAFIYENGFDFT